MFVGIHRGIMVIIPLTGTHGIQITGITIMVIITTGITIIMNITTVHILLIMTTITIFIMLVNVPSPQMLITG